MSLQVWLPLNGSLNNQGLGNISFSATTATWDTSGKIGQALSTLNSNIIGNCPTLNDVSTFSLAFWCFPKTNSSISANWCNIIALGSKSADNSTSAEFRFESSYANNYILSHHNNTGEPIGGGTSSLVSDRDKWYHIVVVANNEAHTIRYYVNGIQLTASGFLKTHNGGHLDGTIRLANENTDPDCLINDVRIYDHCLSDKEVEEIAKGLVLHYKLDDTYVENSNIISCDITETAYNASISKYGYNDTSNLIKTTGNFQGKNCVKIGTRVAGQQACPYAYFSNLFTSDGTNAPAYKALSFDYYTTVPTTTWLNIYKLGSGQGTATWKTINSDGVHSGTYTNSANSIIVKPNEWNHVEVIFHGTTTANAEWGYCINGPNHVSSEEYYFLYANIQLEENDHVTGYGESMHSNIIYDSSGYNNNGNIIGDLTINISNSRYSYSTIFNGTSRIMANSLPAETKTLTCWAKTTKNKSTSQQIVADSNSALTISFYQGTIIGVFGTTRSTGSKSTLGSEYKENDWNFFAVVKTSEDGKRDIYCNGIKLTPTSNDYWSAATGFFIGARNASQGNPFYGEISDVRAYATALTPSQIKELYNTSVTIDNKSNIYARELVEI